MTIKILNPLPGGFTHVGLRRAKRHVRQGRAVFVGDALQFTERHHGHEAALQSNERHTAGGYDKVRRMMTSRELRGIPVVNAGTLLR
jgi:hypothetical protein